MSLEDWARNGWLVEHQTSRQEIEYLLGVADRDMRDCIHPGLSEDWQLAIAYNAALQCATAALVGCGYRAAREAHHHRRVKLTAKKEALFAGHCCSTRSQQESVK